ncbi:IlvD/Edd family dehydratase [Verrucomicrobium sp. BvORR034]|uniref:IlvD/Edd family dehydratase n=1 Tax=Verrucomicrobium sp. BvORR034 TaxID=1396418 RepID=UPI000678D6FE|nr:IlvD/Edd family dehydratase [Verrucomicrobium sp. BvORR034]
MSYDAPESMPHGLRSELWLNNPSNPGMTALYVERLVNYGLTRRELQSGRPIIGISQSGSDISPCNRVHLETVERAKAGVRDSGGVPFVFPVHPIQETVRRPTAALDRNLAYLGMVEVIHGYPFDGVVFTTGCDKTTPAALMAAATVDLPSIMLNSGPMLDGHYKGRLAGSGTIVWESRQLYAAGKIDYEEFMERSCASVPSLGHCNTMGTALSMNSLAEALGMTLPGSAAIPAPYRERGQMAYETGLRIVNMVREDLKPSKVMTRQAFENAIVVNSAIGGSTNCPPHIIAIARHMGVELNIQDWQTHGYDVPLLVNLMPAGSYLGEAFHRAGGVPAVIGELLRAGRIHGEALTVNGRTMQDNTAGVHASNQDVIHTYEAPLRPNAGFLVLTGNLFDSAIIKTSVIGTGFRERYLSNPDSPNRFEGRAVVFEGTEDYHERINDPALELDENSFLVIRGSGSIGYPGAPEVVNMTPPDYLVRRGVTELPCIGDGRQSGTSASPSILNASPESAVGGGLALLQTGDSIVIDLNQCRCDVLLTDEELERRRAAWKPPVSENQTPWQEIHRRCAGQLSTGMCLDFATCYRNVGAAVPRDNH